MLDNMLLRQRREILAGLTATAAGLLASPVAADEAKAAEPPKIIVRRPWADFQAARQVASKAINPVEAEAIMLRYLGALPWYFYGETDEGSGQPVQDINVMSIARMSPPENEGEVTGAWAVALTRKAGSDRPGHYMLILCGRIKLKVSTRFGSEWDRYIFEVPRIALGPLYGHVAWTLHYGMAVMSDDGLEVLSYEGRGRHLGYFV